MPVKRIIALALVVPMFGVFTLTGCGGKVVPGEEEVVPVSEQAAAQPAAKPAPKEKPPAPKPEFLNKQLALNGSFEEWENGVPNRWDVQNGRAITRTEETISGKYAAKLEALDGDQWVALEKTIPADNTILGGNVEASVLARATKGDLLGFALEVQAQGQTVRSKTFHPGDGEWRTLTLSMSIPENADPGTLTLEIFRMPKVEGDAVVDLAKMTVTQ
ncbi:MAG: hypothetical protein IT368_16105 [Candidatus Hydrogenedentes bacterium]|nr:hypothetical protein [Candidatus Hydrogenedentota bacterium]